MRVFRKSTALSPGTADILSQPRDPLKVPGESQRHFKEAMKKGHVRARISTVLLHGSAGSGKTCSKALIAGEDPPAVRQSTPVAARPTRIFRFDVHDEAKWKKLSPQQRKRVLAELLKTPPISKATNQEMPGPHMHADIPPPEVSYVASNVQISPTESSPKPSQEVESDSKDSSLPGLITDEELVNLMENLDDIREEPILQLDMMHIIDTGGQPQCHDLMRAFVNREVSLFMFVINLNDKFDDKPLVAYYNEGHLISSDTRATQTNAQILQQCIRTSNPKTSKMLFLGTHLDEESRDEDKAAKNNKLIDMTLHVDRNNIFSYKAFSDPEELIFPINALRPGNHEGQIIKTMRNLICKKCISDEFDLPLQWYGLEILIEELSELLKRKVILKSECLSASRKFHFDIAGFNAAIEYLDRHCLIHYYCDILPEIVFSDVQVLFDKATELVEESYSLKSNAPTPSYVQECDNKEMWREFCRNACVSHELLSHDRFKKHYIYKDDMFTPTHLIKLFTELRIFADNGEGKYYMPAILDSLKSAELQAHRVSPSATPAPLLLHFPDGGLQLGLFCCLIVFFLSKENKFPKPWRLQCGRTINKHPRCLKRNCVIFSIPGCVGSISLIDSFHHLEVHFKCPLGSDIDTKTSLICKALNSGLKDASNKLGYTDVSPKLCFACPCKKIKFHYAEPCSDDPFLACSVNENEYNKLQDSHRTWLKAFSQAGSPSHTSSGTGSLVDSVGEPTASSASEAASSEPSICSQTAEAFQSLLPELVKAVDSPRSLATELYASKLIAFDMADDICTSSLSKNDKSRTLMMSLQARLEGNPSDFETIMRVFEKSTALSPGIADKLRQLHNPLKAPGPASNGLGKRSTERRDLEEGVEEEKEEEAEPTPKRVKKS